MRIGIIGAGISGLAAAWELRKAGHEAVIFERGAKAGGLISTFDFDGVTIERYYHFLCRNDTGYFDLCRELGLDDRIRWQTTRTGFFYNGREWPFTTALHLLQFSPLSFRDRMRFGLFALEARLRQEWVQLDEIRAKPWLIDRVGRKAYDIIWHPLLAFKFGEVHETISAAWVWHRVHRVAKSKGVMGYLEGGSGYLLDRFVERLRVEGVEVREGCGVKRIVGNDRVEGLELENGDVFHCDHVISTVPLPIVGGLIEQTWPEYGHGLESVGYIGVVCAVFKLRRPVTANFWLNIHDPRIATNGIIEYTNLHPVLPGGESIAYVPYYVATDTPLYQMADEAIFRRSWDYIRMVNEGLGDDDLLGWRVFRAPYAQAVCPVHFLDTRPPAEGVVDGLHLLDSTYIYPEDRTQSGMILLARDCVRRMLNDNE